jgi:phospholipid/cholesterol/gamma-HCH transport system permease protein
MAAPAKAETSATIPLSGRLTAYTVGPVWDAALETLKRNPNQAVVVDAAALESVDDTGIALLFDLVRRPRPAGAAVEIRNLAPNLEALVKRFDPKDFAQSQSATAPPGLIESVGRAAAEEARDARGLIAFLGEASSALAAALAKPRAIRWKEVVAIGQEAGANALPITLLIGFLMGVIIAFEMGVVARQFGAVIFVVNGVGIAILRELGPLMTAIIFAGRSGAAFAAEIGTQKVNEEVNALTTFGLDPVRFLVVPRLIASVIAVPLLAVFANLIGLFGGALVMLTFDITFIQFYHQLLHAVQLHDLIIGLVKSVVFGLLVAGIGCQRGLATGLGAASVGLSATSAVVKSIVLIVVTDGVFAVLVDRLGY